MLALAEQHRTSAGSGVVEVISEVGAVRHRFRQLQESARHEVRSMMVPELAVVRPDDNAAESAGVRRGVLYRTIVQRDALNEPGMVTRALADLAAGQRIGVTDVVPVKFMIADRDLAMLPLLSGRNTAAASVLVHAGGLLDALVAYFELAWEQAYPLSPRAAGTASPRSARTASRSSTPACSRWCSPGSPTRRPRAASGSPGAPFSAASPNS